MNHKERLFLVLLCVCVCVFSQGVAAEAGESGAQQQLARLRYFTAHVKNTTDRMEQAKNGLHQYTSAQLDMLEVRTCYEERL